MPYVQRKYHRNLPPNMGLYRSKHGVRVYQTNKNYNPKKSRAGVLLGTDLSWEDCADIQSLVRMGCKKKSLLQHYGLSRYYLNKVLSISLE